MNTGQMMITLGAVLLLSTIVLRVNSSQLSTQDSMQNTKFGILAISLATSVIDKQVKKHLMKLAHLISFHQQQL